MKLNEQNILFFTRTMKLGGTENVILQLCEILQPKVNKIVVCSCGGVNVENLNKMNIKHYQIEDIENKSIFTFLTTAKRLKKIVKEENITVIHTHHRMAAFYVSLLRLYKQCKFINTSHNTFTNKKILTRFSYKNASLITCGEMVKKNLVEVYKLPENQITVIHNAVKPFDGKIISDPIIEKFHNEGMTVVGNIGRLSEQKGMKYFIEAAEITYKLNKKVRFIIVGDGEKKEELQALVINKKLQNVVLFLGYRDDIQNLMIQLDFIVLSSLWEGLPLTPIEAYSVEKTVIGTAVDGTPEIICDGIDGFLIKPKDIIQLSERMNYLIENPKVRERLEVHAYRRYFDEFSFEKFVQRYLDFYKKLIY